VTADAGRSLHQLALAGDEGAFEALIGPLVEPALRLAFSMLGDRIEAEDAAQEAITQVSKGSTSRGRLHAFRNATGKRYFCISISTFPSRRSRSH
jgi:DNA-directed RNA polymerase specialized sigma24 family protein